MEILVGLRLNVPNNPGVQGVLTERSTAAGTIGVNIVRWLDKKGRPQITPCNDDDIIAANPVPVDWKARASDLEGQLARALTAAEGLAAHIDKMKARNAARKSKRK